MSSDAHTPGVKLGFLLQTGALLLGACGEEEFMIEVDFSARVDGIEVECGGSYDVGTGPDLAQLADARIFVSEIETLDQSGDWVAVELESSPWQSDGVVLLDFEDGRASCSDSGTSETNRTLRGTVGIDEPQGLRFGLGVPFDQNHNDSAMAGAPFSVPGMFWNWRGGYKFLRVDWVAGTARWNIHLGSTACDASSPTEAPASCARSNRSRYSNPDFEFESDRVELDLEALTASANLSVNTPESPPGCMSSPVEPDDCTPIFDALGMDFVSGDCAGSCEAQRLFLTP